MADPFDASRRIDVIDLDDRDLIDLSAPETLADAVGPRWQPSRARALVALALVAVLAVAAFHAVAWLGRPQIPPAEQATSPQWTAVSEYFEALRSDDAKRLRASTTDDVEWRGYDELGNLVSGPYLGEGYLAVADGPMASYHYDQLGDPTVRADTVFLPVRVDLGRYGAYDAALVVVVRQEGSELRVARVMTIRSADSA